MISYNGNAMPSYEPKSTTDGGLILAFTEDLFLQPRLQDAAQQLGFDLQVIDDPEVYGPVGSNHNDGFTLTEPLAGPDSELIRQLSAAHPALLLFDTSSRNIPWRHWIQMLKTSAASRRIPIVAFGPHVDGENLAAAQAAGADQVFTRGQFQNRLANILQTWAEQPAAEELRAACQGSLSELAEKGIEHHNRGEYFAAHEEFEHAWMEAKEYEGYLYRALLQVSVAHLHLERDNLPGAAKLLMRVHRWLDPLPGSCRGIDLNQLRHSVSELRALLYQALDGGEAAPVSFRPIRFNRSGGELEAKEGG